MPTYATFCGALALGSLLLAGCVSKTTEQTQYSGFLPGYQNLQEAKSPSGQPVLRWVSPSFDSANYDTVAFDKLVLYPAPKPDDRVDLKTLQELQLYASNSVKSVLSKRYLLVPDRQAAPPGSHVLEMHAAITGVSASNEGMHWYEVVPVAAVVGAVSAASGHRDQNTELYVEAYFVDAGSGQTVAKVVRKVFGETLSNESEKITADDFKTAIRGLTGDMAAFFK